MTFTINYATTNKAKVDWLKKHLDSSKFKIIQHPVEMVEIRSLNAVEVSKEKSEQAFEIIKKPLIVDDSGFYINALGNFPATNIHFIIDDSIGIEGILKLMKNVKDRSCYFLSALTYTDGKLTKTFIGKYPGRITKKKLGTKDQGWGPLHKIFLANGFLKTGAQMSKKEWFEYQQHCERNGSNIKFRKWIMKKMM